MSEGVRRPRAAAVASVVAVVVAMEVAVVECGTGLPYPREPQQLDGAAPQLLENRRVAIWRYDRRREPRGRSMVEVFMLYSRCTPFLEFEL
jgi:hypothetical protein